MTDQSFLQFIKSVPVAHHFQAVLAGRQEEEGGHVFEGQNLINFNGRCVWR